MHITERCTSTIKNIDNNLLDLSEPDLMKTLLFGSNSLIKMLMQMFPKSTIEYVPSTKRFEELLFNKVKKFSNKVINQ